MLLHVNSVKLRKDSSHGMYHEYESHMEFLDHLYKGDLNVFFKFPDNIIFRIEFGRVNRSKEFRSVIKNLFEEVYKACGSSICIEKSGDGKSKIILNFAIEIPKQKHELDEDICVGVDLGIAVPAVCAVNTSYLQREYIGNVADFLRVRTQLQSQRRRAQSNAKYSKGGHGRKKKLQSLERYSKKEANFVQTYNHMVSKRIVDFAIKNNAKYINIENLKGFNKNDKSSFVLRNWSYFQLQNYITYKANMHGIEVRKVNPVYTSQTCSCCGNRDSEQRKTQAEFRCINPECKMYLKPVNADFNAARNISMSTDFSDEFEAEM